MSFIQDRINEPDETFSMRLDSNSDVLLPTGTGVFYRQLIQCTIIDGDGKACPLLNIVRQIFLRAFSVDFSVQCDVEVFQLMINIECVMSGGILESIICSFDGQPGETC